MPDADAYIWMPLVALSIWIVSELNVQNRRIVWRSDTRHCNVISLCAGCQNIISLEWEKFDRSDYFIIDLQPTVAIFSAKSKVDFFVVYI